MSMNIPQGHYYLKVGLSERLSTKSELGKSLEQGKISRSEVACRHCGRDAAEQGPAMVGVW